MGEIPGFPNLVPFTGGHDPRRQSGRPAFSRRVLAHLNQLADTDEDGRAAFDLATLKAISEDGQVDHAKAVAAGILAHVREVGWDKICRQPKSLSMLSWLFDRQLGKPHVQVDVTHHRAPARTASEIVADIARLMERTPALAVAVRKIADGAPVETKAIEIPAGSPSLNQNDLVIRSLK